MSRDLSGAAVVVTQWHLLKTPSSILPSGTFKAGVLCHFDMYRSPRSPFRYGTISADVSGVSSIISYGRITSLMFATCTLTDMYLSYCSMRRQIIFVPSRRSPVQCNPSLAAEQPLPDDSRFTCNNGALSRVFHGHSPTRIILLQPCYSVSPPQAPRMSNQQCPQSPELLRVLNRAKRGKLSNF